jgi:hypothetical protein
VDTSVSCVTAWQWVSRDHFAHTSLGPEIADSQLPEEAVNVFAESDVIHKSVPVKEPRA